MKIDLHIHTTMSDGAFTPKEVIDMASLNKVEIMSITDHDTIDSYTDELFEYSKKKGITLINGVEISAKTNNYGVHILGYNYDLNSEEFRNSLYEIRNSRHIYLKDVSKKLKELGYEINVEKLDKIDAVTKANIALDVVENPKNKDLIIKNFGRILNRGEFIESVMNKGCPAYVEKKTITPKRAAELIRNAGGKVVLAHPVAYVHEKKLDENDIQEIVDEIKPDGIEANYIYFSSDGKMYNEVEKWTKFTEDNNLFSTVGSDFHNKDGIRAEIGFANIDFSLGDDKIQDIIKNLYK